MLGRPVVKLVLSAVAALLLVAPASGAGKGCFVVPSVNDRCPRWEVTYDAAGPEGNVGHDWASSVAASPSGDRIFVAGEAGAGAPAIDVLALGADTGATLWKVRIAGTHTAWGGGRSLTIAPDGSRLFLMATTANKDMLIMALDPGSGATLWSTEYDGPARGSDYARDLALSPDAGQVYLVGRSSARVGSLVLLALDAGDGTLQWSVRYRGPYSSSGDWDSGHAVEVAPDGRRVYVAGRSDGSSSSDLVTLAYDVPQEDEQPASTWAWVRRFVPFENGGLSAKVGLAVSADGSRVVTSGEGFNNFWTLAYGAAGGEELWTAELHGTKISDGWAGSADESIVEISGERVFVGITKALDPGPLLASFDLATGAKRWEVRNPSGPPLATSSMVLSPDGETVYALASTEDAGQGAAVLAYDADTGAQLWVGRTNRAAHSTFGLDLAISSSGETLFPVGSIRPLDWDGQVQGGTEDFLVWSVGT